MSRAAWRTAPESLAARIARALTLLLLVTLGTILLMRFAPGYSSEAAELDPRYAQSARARLEMHATSPLALVRDTFTGLLHGDLGRSRQYDLPVSDLVRPRLAVSLNLLLRSIALGWLISFSLALLVAHRRRLRLLALPFTLLLAVPTGAMATVCLLSGQGGPTLVLTILIAARDFKFSRLALQHALAAPYLLQARAQGLGPLRILRAHLLPEMLPRLRALAFLSILTAVSALVPVEVLFDEPGVGQLAWSAALNRDLPVLLAVTLLVAAVVLAAGLLADPPAAEEFL